MVLTRDDLISKVSTFIGENNSDEAISLLEDVTDTFDSVSTPADTEDWKAKYEENDTMWRNKYMSRFSAPSEAPQTTVEGVVEDSGEGVQVEESIEDVTIDDIFE